MANSKNTIQKIPLNGTLNMNTLKTEVKQFEGFNEKNSTVFGGTLSPFFDKTTPLYDVNDSYTVFNSKGTPYTLLMNGDDVCLLKNNTTVYNGKSTLSTKTEILNVPEDTISTSVDYDGNPIYVTKYGEIKCGSITRDSEITDVLKARIWVESPTLTYIALVGRERDHIIVIRNGSLSERYFSHNTILSLYSPLITGVNANGLFNISVLTNSGRLEVKDENIKNFECYNYTVDLNNNFNKLSTVGYWKETFNNSTPEFVSFSSEVATYECHQFASRKLVKDKDTYFLSDDKACGAVDGYLPCPVGHKYSFAGSAYYLNGSLISIGHMNTPITACLSFEDNMVNTLTDNYGDYHIIYHSTDDRWYHYQSINIKDKDNKSESFENMVFDKRYIFFKRKDLAKTFVYDIETDKLIKDIALDWILDSTPWVKKSDLTLVERSDYYSFENHFTLSVNRPNEGKHTIHITISQAEVDPDYDHTYYVEGVIERDQGELTTSTRLTILKGSKESAKYTWDYGQTLTSDAKITVTGISNTDSSTPATITISLGGSDSKTSTWSRIKSDLKSLYNTTGCVFGGGYNAGYAISNAQFVGYLPNPYVVSNFPQSSVVNYPEVPEGVQFYCTVDNQATSAKYVGKDSRYFGTTLAIDSTGNVILPVSTNGKIISGYSNNDLVKENSTVYPLMYWNNNQKTYTYFLLSGIENMTNVFSLQGQQYTVDANNIYAVSFANGIVQSVQTVCYKKNLQFLGTLPSQAIFWSSFNKTLYSFTGDRLISKMFEASDIGKIKYVGQNPSSLSLWICTDKGAYVLSDTDTYRLNYICEEVVFIEDRALIITSNDEGKQVHQISLWDIGNGGEMVPVKLKTAYFGLGAEQKSVMDCWYIRLFDENRVEGEVKVKVNTITDITRHSEEKTFKINPSDYDENSIVYLRYQPKYQECTAMQLELESNIGIYELAIGVNATDSTAQVSKLNF